MVTTLFQCAVPKKDDLSAQSAKVSESGGWLIDPYGTGYFIPDGQSVKHQVGLQESRHSHSKKKTSGTFSTAWIDHGVAQKDVGYYYQVILDASPDEMKAWKKSQKATPFVKILQKMIVLMSSLAHRSKLRRLLLFPSMRVDQIRCFVLLIVLVSL